MKRNLQNISDFPLFDDYAQLDSFTSEISGQCPVPQGGNISLYTSQLNTATISSGLVERCYSPKNISQQDSLQFTSDWQPRTQFRDQAESVSLGSVNPSQIWTDIDPFAPQSAYKPNQFLQQSSDLRSMTISAKPLGLNMRPDDRTT